MEVNDIISSGLLELYAAGLASQEEAVQVQQWVKQYPEVADELAAIETSLAMYAQANAMQPGASVKEKVFERINAGEKTKIVSLSSAEDLKVVKISPAWKNAAAAAIVLLIASAVLNIIQYNKGEENRTALIEKERQLKETIATNDSLQQNNRSMGDYVEVARDPNSRSIAVNVANAPDSSAKVFWMKNSGDVFVDPSNLPVLSSDKQYELWAIVDGAPVNAGIIITTEKGKAYKVQQMKSFGVIKVQAFAVSVEPKSPAPAAKPTVVYAVGPTI